MPVPRLRGRDDRVEYVVVRRTALDGKEEVDDFENTPSPTATVDELLDRSNAQLTPRDDDHHESFPPPPPPPPILITMTLPQAQATGGALANKDASGTVVVSISPPPLPPPPHRGGISQTTEHLLIAAGSIGATIIIVMIVLAIYTLRKRGLTLRQAVKQGKYQVTGREPSSTDSRAGWDTKQAYNADYGSTRDDTVFPSQPAAAIARSGSNASQRPLMALDRSDSFNRQATTERSISPGTTPQRFLLDPPPYRNNSHLRNNSGTPSSPVLPLQNQRRSISTRNTRSVSDGSELQYPEPPQERALSPLPPPPTFKQFLFNRPSVSGRPAPGGGIISRFSWTNSNAPQTPHDPNRDTNSHTIGRDSFMTQRSSVPRFRTVDSWVNQQTNRLEEQKLKDQFRLTATSTIFSGDDEHDTVPEVPTLPKDVTNLRDGVTPNTDARPAPKIPPTPSPRGLPGKNVRHERNDTRTTVDTAPIFRQHPGTEVRFSTRSAVPSEILDMGRKPNVLS